MKKALGEAQTLRAGCSKEEPKKFAPPQIRFPRAQDGQNLTSWRWSLPSPTDPVWRRWMQAILSYRGNRPTKPQRHNARPLARCKQEAQLMLTTGSTRLAVSRGQQTWYHSTCYI